MSPITVIYLLQQSTCAPHLWFSQQCCWGFTFCGLWHGVTVWVILIMLNDRGAFVWRVRQSKNLTCITMKMEAPWLNHTPKVTFQKTWILGNNDVGTSDLTRHEMLGGSSCTICQRQYNPVSATRNWDRKWTASIMIASLAQNWVLGLWNNVID